MIQTLEELIATICSVHVSAQKAWRLYLGNLWSESWLYT